MLVIREAQFAALGRHTQVQFQAGMVDMLARNYPREVRQAGGRKAIEVFVNQGLAAAAERGLRSRREASLYLTLMMILGTGFAEDPQLPWVADLLDETAIAHPTVRIENLFAETLIYLDATAGPNCGLVVRAMLRIRDFDLAAVPATAGDEWITDVLAILNGFYPQKFAFQGEAATRVMAEQGMRRAAAYGLVEPVGGFVFLECMFMLGSGFDQDPLQPWASSALNDPAIADGRLRAERLYAGAMEHLAQSLRSE